MNNKIITICTLAIFIASCTSDLENCINTDTPIIKTKSENTMVRSEIAYPDISKELINLNNGMTVEKIDTIYIFQGDIILTQDQIDIFNSPKKRSAVNTSAIRYWPHNTVYYTFASGFEYQNLVNAAIREWESKTSIKFEPKTQYNDYYIEFYHGNGNFSEVGCAGKKQQISLAKGGATTGTAIHEIGHAMGLFHEQCRTDRDGFIRVNWNNIESRARHNFDLFNVDYEGINIGTFDFNSVMLYSSFDFAINEAIPTIERLDGSTFIGQRSFLAPGDIEGITAIYGPPFTKLDVVTNVIRHDSGNTYFSFESESDNTIHFYTDQTYKIRTSLIYPRKIRIYYYSADMGGSKTEETEVLLPAGTTEYSLGQTYCIEDSDYGNTVRYSETKYSIR